MSNYDIITIKKDNKEVHMIVDDGGFIEVAYLDELTGDFMVRRFSKDGKQISTNKFG